MTTTMVVAVAKTEFKSLAYLFSVISELLAFDKEANNPPNL